MLTLCKIISILRKPAPIGCQNISHRCISMAKEAPVFNYSPPRAPTMLLCTFFKCHYNKVWQHGQRFLLSKRTFRLSRTSNETCFNCRGVRTIALSQIHKECQAFFVMASNCTERNALLRTKKSHLSCLFLLI